MSVDTTSRWDSGVCRRHFSFSIAKKDMFEKRKGEETFLKELGKYD